MAPRLQLQSLLEEITDTVYFQPPANVSLTYPCIVYKRDSARTDFADNEPYARKIRYQITVIDKNPDSLLPDAVAALPMCLFDRFYTADNLNHDVFNIFF